MIKVLFVCHGNICRSPMAEYILKDMAKKQSLEDKLQIDSAATSREELGNDVYPPARRCLQAHDIACPRRQARQVCHSDLTQYDWILYMERYNESGLRRILGSTPEGKVIRLLDLTDRPRDVDDPWYTGDFEQAYTDIVEGCEALLHRLEDCI